jgi:hypothetical protein
MESDGNPPFHFFLILLWLFLRKTPFGSSAFFFANRIVSSAGQSALQVPSADFPIQSSAHSDIHFSKGAAGPRPNRDAAQRISEP